MSNEETTNSGEDQEELVTEAETENVYPSSEILLSTITREYDAEANRKRDIETRAGVLIALLGALIGFYATALDFSFFKKANSPVEMLCFVIIALLFIFPAIMQLIAFKHLINVLKTYQYESLGLGGFNPLNLEKSAKRGKDELQFLLTSAYHAVVEKNSIANDTKAKLFKKGTEKIYISIIGIVLVYFFKQIILLMI
ncbi:MULTISPECIES: hypothetical protein [Bacillus]|uniref:hypothetical protein n=1 Tax=Bacillus TaxID=1386 RepID=UPI0005D44E86|nr:MULTISPECIES: hypothetical protein [Bacillus]KJF47100.1 hypothetical protein BAIE_12665 [Bacillus altitudinis]MBR0592078.1 hypothetical protein [Bacillus pumilus sxm20-2]SPR94837.1 conserved membrane hypothetical protein [Bacillus altitudinis]